MPGMGGKENIYKIVTLAMLVLIIAILLFIAATSTATPDLESPDYESILPDNAELAHNNAGGVGSLDSGNNGRVSEDVTQFSEEKTGQLQHQESPAAENPNVEYSGSGTGEPGEIRLNPIIEGSGGIVIDIEPSGEIKLDPETFKWENEVTKDRTPAVGILNTTLEALQDENAVHLDFSMDNISGEELNLRYGSGQRYDFTVKDIDGREIYRWSHDKCFTTSIVDIALKPGEKMSFTEIWDYRDNNGVEAPPGEYFITVFMSASLRSGGTISFEDISAAVSIQVR